jgi:hypothetical protein
MDDVGRNLTQCRHAFSMPKRLPQREQLALACRQLGVAKREVASRLVNSLVKRPVELLQLIEHLVQAGRDRAEFVTPNQRRSCPKVSFPRLMHGPQQHTKGLAQHVSDGKVHEDGDAHDGRNSETERDAQPVGARLKQTLQTNSDGYGVVLATRHRHGDGTAWYLGTHPDQDTLAFRRELLRVIADTGVSLSLIGDIPRRFSAPLDTELARAIEATGKRLLPGVPFATAVGTGASDRPYYASAGIICYGIDPYLVELEEGRREVHGNDERISLENLGFGLRLHLGIMQEMEK